MPSRSRHRMAWATALLVLALVRLVPTPAAWLLPPVVLAGEYSFAVALGALGVLLVAALRRPRRPRAALVAGLAALVAAGPAVEARAALAAGRVAVDQLSAAGGTPPTPADSVEERTTRYAPAGCPPPGVRAPPADAACPLLTLRRFRPLGAADPLGAGGPARPRPTLVVLYAGAWRSGDAAQGARLHRALARRGYTVVALDYRHAPAHHFPAQREDVRRGLVLVHDSAAAWGVDTARVVLWGRSSGAHLAMLAAWTPGATAGLHVRGVIAFYGPVDLAEGYRRPPTPDPIDVRAVLRSFLGGPPAALPAAYQAASPVAYARAGLPPTLLVYGGRDHVVEPRFGREVAAALRRAGSPVAYVELPWAEHGFDFAAGGVGARAADALVMRFLARVQ